jgi:23S rRNA (cytidine1920-2'-O)/16S rRNA (cytidine1409-2'-O)-methyltransferase
MGKKQPLKKLLKEKYPDKLEKEIYAMIICGEILVNNEKILDPNALVFNESEIQIVKQRKYVSRGGIKLEHALKEFNINVNNKVFIDAGCSTGGFTHCLLKNSAKHVYSVDVGYNVLDYKIRTDKRVSVFERTNIMNIESKNLNYKPNAAVMDLSFRSIKGAVSHIMKLLNDKIIISLIKPQFEWENPDKEFNGIVKNKNTIFNILNKLIYKIEMENCYTCNFTESPILGRKGNHEYFFLIKDKEEESKNDIMNLIQKTILK